MTPALTTREILAAIAPPLTPAPVPAATADRFATARRVYDTVYLPACRRHGLTPQPLEFLMVRVGFTPAEAVAAGMRGRP